MSNFCEHFSKYFDVITDDKSWVTDEAFKLRYGDIDNLIGDVAGRTKLDIDPASLAFPGVELVDIGDPYLYMKNSRRKSAEPELQSSLDLVLYVLVYLDHLAPYVNPHNALTLVRCRSPLTSSPGYNS